MKSDKSSRSFLTLRAGKEKAVSGGQTALEVRFARAQANLRASRKTLPRMLLENPKDTFFLSSRKPLKRVQPFQATRKQSLS